MSAVCSAVYPRVSGGCFQVSLFFIDSISDCSTLRISGGVLDRSYSSMVFASFAPGIAGKGSPFLSFTVCTYCVSVVRIMLTIALGASDDAIFLSGPTALRRAFRARQYE